MVGVGQNLLLGSQGVVLAFRRVRVFDVAQLKGHRFSPLVAARHPLPEALQIRGNLAPGTKSVAHIPTHGAERRVSVQQFEVACRIEQRLVLVLTV